MKRRPNFSSSEMDALIDGVATSRTIVASACPGRVSKATKEQEWQVITSRVNSVSQLHRTVGEVRKKWKNLRMVTKAKKEALMSDLVQVCRSSGGDATMDAANAALKQLTPAECRVMEILDGTCATASALAEDAAAASDAACSGETEANIRYLAGTTDIRDVKTPQDGEKGAVANDDPEDDWSIEGDERPLVIDRSEIILTPRYLAQPTQMVTSAVPSVAESVPLPPPPPLLPTPTLSLMPTSITAAAGSLNGPKPSILTVVESLHQRRLLTEATSSSATTTPTLISSPQTQQEPATGISAASTFISHHCRCCCCCSASDRDHNAKRESDIGRRLLRVEERQLRLERQKVAALREVVANLKEISRAMAGANVPKLVASPGAAPSSP